MTRVAFMSDLHIDSNDFGKDEVKTLLTLMEQKKIQHLHIAGDIANGYEKRSQEFLAQLQCQLPVTFSLGNHDMLNLSEEAIKPFEFQKISFSKHTLLAFSGWYDYSFVPTISPQKHLQTKNLFWFDRRLKRIGSDPEITKKLLQELEQELQKIKQPLVIAMHFVPHSQFLLRHPYFERFNAFLGSQDFHELFRQFPVREVIFGHSHHRITAITIDTITYHARPLGYIREWELCKQFFDVFPEFDFPKRYDPYKRYRKIKDLPEFQAYKKKQLAHEFSQAMTILEL
jgi:putative phosphoesterase